IHVATVDHGLRPGSDREAAWVAARASELGLPHRVLPWVGPKPRTGRQDAARRARYALLAEHAGRLPPPVAIVVAHHLDDQAETLLMRLGRGSGLDGLAGMKPVRPHAGDDEYPRLPDGADIRIVRPFLAITKARLVATLRDRGLDW